MEVALYFASIDRLLAIEEALQRLNLNDIPSTVSNAIFPEAINNREYYGNLAALELLHSHCDVGEEASRLYFGQEFCEHLIPSPDEVRQAYYFARQLGWEFTYVTGCLTDAGLERTCANLDALAEEGAGEVVVNDWGMLSVLSRDYAAFTPVLGRLLVKQTRLGVSADHGLRAVNMAAIDTDEDDIRANQLRGFRGLSLSNGAYQDELARLGIERVDLDITPQGVSLPEEEGDFSFGFYFPWGYVTGGRNCFTASLQDPVRRHVVLDEPCARPCQSFNCTAPIRHRSDGVTHRGNSVFLFHGPAAQPYINGELPMSRLIFEPYIPI
ncbi:MAG: hypothetical protein HN742_03080 [Lentisphaerae bacterium]|jgi:hypothetical protein|nr:hypothetical protein [Lentisphaerota bacterium]MBT4814622.1 hypothetical protein [Lentisphaerota bacterium]MBT5605453.1 hypothetical protein [Lentisphaerota bacterium]MBT7060116.1 hypothetical protein [Lentisphaerota bacterium]MBT7840824.1 hypothetical protein [Lentisphaerota bacterium]